MTPAGRNTPLTVLSAKLERRPPLTSNLSRLLQSSPHWLSELDRVQVLEGGGKLRA